MASEEEIIIAFIFKRSGATELDFTKFYLTLSMDLNWFTPEDAKQFINRAIKYKLLSKKDETIIPTFDVGKIDVPMGFYPSKRLFEEEPEIVKETKIKEDVFDQIVQKIVDVTKLDVAVVLKEIKELEKEKNITSEVAALLIGKEREVSLDGFFDAVESKLF